MSVITDYIDRQEPAAQPQLRALYQLLQAALPEAEERISYGMPAFWQGRVLVYFAANANHIGFYPTAAPIAAFAGELAGYQTSKGAIQLPYTQPLPTALLTAIAQYRLAHPDAHTAPARRAAVPVPPAIAAALAEAGVTAAYAARPQYQRTDYLHWIAAAKRPATQERRLQQMLTELAAGDVYMKMPWHPRQPKA